MELREWAIFLLSASTLSDKLFYPDHLTDLNPGPELFWDHPTRPKGMEFKKFSRKEKLPAFHEHTSEAKRAACLHRFAGHELLAIEMMAFALLAFPKAPKAFRKGLAHTIKEEQWHVTLYRNRLLQMGTDLGDEPLNGRFWTLTKHFTTPLSYITVMHLTLEMANLDFAPHYGLSFERNGDLLSAELMKKIFLDEISHVSFGYSWLKKFKTSKETSDWQTYLDYLPALTTPKRAKGFIFQEEARKRAHIPQDWITNLKEGKF